MDAHANKDSFGHGRWSLASAARLASPGTDPGLPLRELCLRYWPPVYAYLRRRGDPPDVAAELTARFLDEIAEHRLGAERAPTSHRFREFLLSELQRFLAERDACED